MRRCEKGKVVTQTAERTAQSGSKSACLGGTFEKEVFPQSQKWRTFYSLTVSKHLCLKKSLNFQR